MGHNDFMRLHETIENILGSRIKIGILRLLFRTRGMFSGREVSRLVGFSPTHTISNLRELEAEGLVLRQRAGNTDLYQLNERNSAVEGVLAPIFHWESNLLNELAEMFVDRLGKKLVSIRLFGSVARSEEEVDSDIDLLITVKDGVETNDLEGDVAEIDLVAGQRLGCPVSTILVTESEFAKKVRSKRGFWKDIPGESKVIYERTR
jgi:predicted nucleotidyltransferase